MKERFVISILHKSFFILYLGIIKLSNIEFIFFLHKIPYEKQKINIINSIIKIKIIFILSLISINVKNIKNGIIKTNINAIVFFVFILDTYIKIFSKL